MVGCAAEAEPESTTPEDAPIEQSTKSGVEVGNPAVPLDEYRGVDEPMLRQACIRGKRVEIVTTGAKPGTPSAAQERAALDAVRAYYFGQEHSHEAIFLRCPE